MSVLKIGDKVVVRDASCRLYHLEVVDTPEGKHDCEACEIHHMCNRDYDIVKNLAKEFGEMSCTALIGRGTCFATVKYEK